jgi:prevent-host-death family protein
VFVDSTNRKGAIAEIAIACEATKLGVEVFMPLSDHCRYDLVFGIGAGLYRVQCKTARRQGDGLIINLISNWHTPHGYVRRGYGADEIDLVAAYCPELERSYLLLFDSLPGKSGIQLRLSPPKNAQRAAIHYAADHEFAGAVAQLGRALRWHRRGRGFESHQLHPPEAGQAHAPEANGECTVGAHQFRNHFGYWMERAAAGTEVLITRRGKRFARLGPADRTLDLTTSDAD